MAYKHATWNALITDFFRHEYIYTKDLIAVNLAAKNATMDLSRMDTNLKVNVLYVGNRGTVLLIFDYLQHLKCDLKDIEALINRILEGSSILRHLSCVSHHDVSAA